MNLPEIEPYVLELMSVQIAFSSADRALRQPSLVPKLTASGSTIDRDLLRRGLGENA